MLVALLLTALTAVGIATIDPVFTMLGAHGEVLRQIHAYLLVYFPGTVLFTRHDGGGQRDARHRRRSRSRVW